jgi:DNA-binding XRE family transcriptional regulator
MTTIRKPRFTDNQTAALIGRIVMLEELVATLLERAEQQDCRNRQIEERLARVVSRSQLITETELAETLDVSVQTLARWRKEMPAPRIPLVLTEDGNIRYRVESIKNYLRGRERGASKRL